jgi:hypothetical protein
MSWLLDGSVLIVHGRGGEIDELVIGENVGLIFAWNIWISAIWKRGKVTPLDDGRMMRGVGG